MYCMRHVIYSHKYNIDKGNAFYKLPIIWVCLFIANDLAPYSHGGNTPNI